MWRTTLSKSCSRAADSGVSVKVSKIFEWYASDFRPSVLAWLRTFAPELRIPRAVQLSYRAYDWRLNDQRRGNR